jgi:hypothetical protein
MPWCVTVCERRARPSPKRATSNRVFGFRAEKRGGISARFAITHAPCHYQRAPEKVFYPCTRTSAPARSFQIHHGASLHYWPITMPLLDACGGHLGVTPDSQEAGEAVYHYHVQVCWGGGQTDARGATINLPYVRGPLPRGGRAKRVTPPPPRPREERSRRRPGGARGGGGGGATGPVSTSLAGEGPRHAGRWVSG